MVPYKDGKANHGHSCVKGRFAWGYATHKDRITKPMIREKITDPWREVTLGRGHRLRRLRVQAHPGEVRPRLDRRHHLLALHERGDLPRPEAGPRRLRQQQRRYLRARLPFADRLRPEDDVRHLGRHAGLRLGREGRRHHRHRREPDRRAPGLRLAHEAAAARGRAAHRRRSAPHRPGARRRTSRRDYHLQLLPGTNVAMINAIAHVVVTEGLVDEAYRARALRLARLRALGALHRARSAIRPRRWKPSPACPPPTCAPPRGSTRPAATRAIYYGLGVTEHSQGSTMVMGMANLAMATGNIGRDGVGVNPLRGQNNVQGVVRHGLVPARVLRLPPRLRRRDARTCSRQLWGVALARRAGPAHPQHVRRGGRRHLQGPLHPGRGHRPVRPQHAARRPRALEAMECVVVQDLFLNETAKYAHVFLPGSSFLEKDGTFTNAERRISRVRKVMPPLAGMADWEVTRRALEGARATRCTTPIRREIMDEIARADADLRRRDLRQDRRARLRSSGRATRRRRRARRSCTSTGFVRGKGQFMITEFVPTRGAHRRALPADPHHRPHPLASTTSARRRGAPTTSSGTTRTCWRSTRSTRRTAASATAISWRWPAASGETSLRAHGHRAHAAGRRLHDLPPRRDRRQRRHDRVFRLGHELPRIQGHGRRRCGARTTSPNGRSATGWTSTT